MKFIKFYIKLISILILLILLITIIIIVLKFNPQKYHKINKVKKSGNINDIYNKIGTGDIIFFLSEYDRSLLSPTVLQHYISNSYISHIGIVYKKNNILYLVECIDKNDNSNIKGSLLTPIYNGGVRMVPLISVFENEKYRTSIGIRFKRKKINNKKFFKELEKMKYIKFEKTYMVNLIAIIGLIFLKVPNNYKTGMCNLVPTRNDEDGYFCSEFIAVILQRLNIMNKKYNARLYFPFSFLEQYDNENFGKLSPYSKTYYFTLPNTKKI